MNAGDLVLFYQDGSYIGIGYIAKTFEDEDGWVRSTFWKNAPSNLIYVIRDYASISVPRSKVNQIFDYSESYYPQGLTRVADDRVTNRIEAIQQAVAWVSDE